MAHRVPCILVKQEDVELQLKQIGPLSQVEQGVRATQFGVNETPAKSNNVHLKYNSFHTVYGAALTRGFQ